MNIEGLNAEVFYVRLDCLYALKYHLLRLVNDVRTYFLADAGQQMGQEPLLL